MTSKEALAIIKYEYRQGQPSLTYEEHKEICDIIEKDLEELEALKKSITDEAEKWRSTDYEDPRISL